MGWRAECLGACLPPVRWGAGTHPRPERRATLHHHAGVRPWGCGAMGRSLQGGPLVRGNIQCTLRCPSNKWCGAQRCTALSACGRKSGSCGGCEQCMARPPRVRANARLRIRCTLQNPLGRVGPPGPTLRQAQRTNSQSTKGPPGRYGTQCNPPPPPPEETDLAPWEAGMTALIRRALI